MPLEITETFEYFFIAAMAMMIYAALYFVESEWKLGGQNSLCVLKLETPLPHKPTVHQFLLQYRDRIRDAMQEDFNQIFFRKIQDLYPKLEEHGIQMPCVRPYVDSDQWRNYHIRFLKDLEMQIPNIEDGVSLNLEQWSNQVLNIEKARDVYMGDKVLLSDRECKMLRFIFSIISKRPVTTSDIYTHEPFLKVDPGELHLAFMHLLRDGYIVAEERKDNNPLAPPSARMFAVQDVTEKGRKAIGN